MTLKSQKQLYQFLESIICGEDVKTKEEMSMDDDIVTSEYDSKISEYADFIDDVEEVTVDECFMDDINNDNLYLQDHRSSEAVKDNIINIDDTDTAVIFTLGVNSTENEFQLLSPDKVYVCDETDTEMISGINYDCSNDDQFGHLNYTPSGNIPAGHSEADDDDRTITVENVVIGHELLSEGDDEIDDDTKEDNEYSAKKNCEFCDKTFVEDTDLTDHVNDHLKRCLFPCPECDNKFTKQHNLTNHLMSIHRYSFNVYSCDICRWSSRYKFALQRHMLSRHLNKPQHCVERATDFSSACVTNQRAADYRNSTVGRYYECAHCSANFIDKRLLIDHIKSFHIGRPIEPPSYVKVAGTDNFKCHLCDFSTSSQTDVSLHEFGHRQPRWQSTNDPYKYKCAKCGQYFKLYENYERHVRQHPDKRYKCSLCEKRFINARNKAVHMRAVHNKIREFQCSECGKQFAYQNSLKKHMEMHDGTKKMFVCDICGRFITSKISLRNHRNLHLGNKMYQCDRCDKRYTNNLLLKRHAVIHDTGWEPEKSKCHICSNMFSKLYLAKHMLTHNASRNPLSCNFCEKKYFSFSRYNQHLLTHRPRLRLLV